MDVVMLLYPRLTQLDLTGPLEVFSRCPEFRLHLVWKTREPVADGSGVLQMAPTITFAEAPAADILFVPGGPGQVALMEDEETLAFLRRQADRAAHITAVCTGSLVLAAAGLLSGYRATSHWQWRGQLGWFGAEPVDARVVEDRDRITGGGVTAGIDFALVLVARLFGDERAKAIQLAMEYDPQPPFAAGAPGTAGEGIVAAVASSFPAFRAKREAACRRAAARLRGGAVEGTDPAP